jgi:hypothetical protein
MRRSRLDLPVPLGPVKTSAPPAATAKLSSAKTQRSPRMQVRSRPSKSGMSVHLGRLSGAQGARRAVKGFAGRRV